VKIKTFWKQNLSSKFQLELCKSRNSFNTVCNYKTNCAINLNQIRKQPLPNFCYRSYWHCWRQNSLYDKKSTSSFLCY